MLMGLLPDFEPQGEPCRDLLAKPTTDNFGMKRKTKKELLTTLAVQYLSFVR